MFKFLLQLEHKHKNIIFLFLGIIVAFIFSQQQWFNNFLLHMGRFGYLSAFLAGMMFASTFTVATGALILLTLAKNITPFWLIILGGLGAATTDLLIFRFVKDDVVDEITPIYDQITGSHFKKIIHTKYFAWTLPVLGALIILSPFPDELGVSLIGLEQIRTSKFILISLVSHTIGMTALVGASAIFS